MDEDRKTCGYAFTVTGPDGEAAALYAGQVEIGPNGGGTFSYIAVPIGGGEAGIGRSPVLAVLDLLRRAAFADLGPS